MSTSIGWANIGATQRAEHRQQELGRSTAARTDASQMGTAGGCPLARELIGMERGADCGLGRISGISHPGLAEIPKGGARVVVDPNHRSALLPGLTSAHWCGLRCRRGSAWPSCSSYSSLCPRVNTAACWLDTLVAPHVIIRPQRKWPALCVGSCPLIPHPQNCTPKTSAGAFRHIEKPDRGQGAVCHMRAAQKERLRLVPLSDRQRPLTELRD